MTRVRRANRRKADRFRRAAAAIDRRVVASRGCGWWDSIQAAGQHPTSGLPCCPHCHAMLFEWSSIGHWQMVVTNHAAETGDERYPAFVDWMRGRCLPMVEAREMFDAEVAALPAGTDRVVSLVDRYRARMNESGE